MNSKTRRKLAAENARIAVEAAAEIWTPFVQAEMPELSAAEVVRRTGFPIDQAQAFVDEQRRQPDIVFLNNLYQVNIRKLPSSDDTQWTGQALHLSIKRRDKAAVHDWRHFQRIKNELVGPECEGVELYPAESRLVDTANQYHLWVIADPKFRFPLGFDDGRWTRDDGPIGGKQRPGADQGGAS